jgi:alkaline phosphatase D
MVREPIVMNTTTARSVALFLVLAVLLVGHARATESAPASALRAGPMVGATSMRQVKLWLQATGEGRAQIEYWDLTRPHEPRRTGAVALTEDTDYVAQFLVGPLEPGRGYGYRVLINGAEQKVPQTLAFRSQALWQWRSDAPDWRLAFSSCGFVNDPAYDRPGRAYGGPPEAKRIYDSMAAAKPDLTLWGGDYLYFREADEDSELGMRARWKFDRGTPEQQPLLRTGSHIAVWDDHEYGPNNANQSFHLKGEALRLFKQYWANPAYGLPDAPGTYTTQRFNDAQFFLLDNRTYRDSDDLQQKDKTILGAAQLRWLKNALLASASPIKIIVSGSQVFNDNSTYDGWHHYREERDAFLAFLKVHKISGVVFLSGDRHFTALMKRDRANDYPLYELTCSPLLSGIGSNIPVERANPSVVPNTFVAQRNFCTLDVEGPAENRQITLRSFDAAGKTLWTHALKLSALQPPKQSGQ